MRLSFSQFRYRPINGKNWTIRVLLDHVVRRQTRYGNYVRKDDHKFLEGRYVTDRIVKRDKMGVGGFIQLVWVSKTLRTQLLTVRMNGPFKPPPQPALIAKDSRTISKCRDFGDQATEDQSIMQRGDGGLK